MHPQLDHEMLISGWLNVIKEIAPCCMSPVWLKNPKLRIQVQRTHVYYSYQTLTRSIAIILRLKWIAMQ